jgi:hypothetical protein
LDWFEKGLLPDMPVVRNLQTVLDEFGANPDPATLSSVEDWFKEGIEDRFWGLADLLTAEVKPAMDIRNGGSSPASLKEAPDVLLK